MTVTVGRFLWCCFVCATVFIGSARAQNEVEVKGDKYEWIVKHRGLSTDNYLPATNSDTAIGVVASAVKAAKNADRVAFDAYFNGSTSNDSRDSLFKEWQIASREFPYVIVSEAAPKNNREDQSSFPTAFSLVPFGLTANQNRGNGLSHLKANVVFVTRTNREWKLFLGPFDPKLYNYLVSQASESGAHSDPQIFHSEADLKSSELRSRMSNEVSIIEGMRKSGASEAQINGIKENFSLENGGLQGVETNWAMWKDRYHFQELTPPKSYDVRDSWPADYASLLAAQRSYRHAISVGDAETLLKFADESGKKAVHSFIGDEKVKKPTYEVFPKITKYTVLFTASTELHGNNYFLVFFRAQENVDARNGTVLFQSDIFKRTPTGYVFTGDLDPSSTFGNPGRAANLGFAFFLKYPRFYEIASKSEFPQHYYKIDE
jgi:hypothetical protein